MKIQGWILWLHVASLGSTTCRAFQHRASNVGLNPDRFRYTSTTTTSTNDASSCQTRSTRLYFDPYEKIDVSDQKQVSDQQVEELLQDYVERSRVKRRDVFTSADWIRHRRPDRFIDHLLSIYESGLLRAMQFQLLVLTAFSTFIVLYNDIFVNGVQGWNGQIAYVPTVHLFPLQLPLTPFILSTTALGLLLTFRTNVSYSRWNEARTAWGAIINDSRSVARMGCIWATSYKQIDNASLVRLGEAVCSFSRALMNGTLPPQEDAERFVEYTYNQLHDQGYAQILRRAKHRPSAALAELTQILVEYQLNPIHQVEVERIITSLCNSLGACERIFSSPVPVLYTRHTARFLVVWLFSLPLGMYDSFGSTWNHVGLIPVCFGLGLFFLGIEELATQMEEPFSILPMEKMCEGSIRNPIMEQVQRSVESASMRPKSMVTSWVSSYPTPSSISTSETSATIPSTVSESMDDNEGLGSFFVAQPLSYNGMPEAAPKRYYQSSSSMTNIGDTMTGMVSKSYVDALPRTGSDEKSFSYQVSVEANGQKPSPSFSQSTHESTAEPSVTAWNYGGTPSAPSPNALSSYNPKTSSSYKTTSGSGIPSYLDNMYNRNSNDHQQQYSSGSTASFNGDSSSSEPKEPSTPASEPLRHGGMPSATTSWNSSYMPESSYKSSGSGIPSYIDRFNNGVRNSPQEPFIYPPSTESDE